MTKKAKKELKNTNTLASAVFVAVLGLVTFGYALRNYSAPVTGGSTGVVEAASTNGFDTFGYNRNARIFNGPADGVDKVLDGKLWGDATYAKDKLTMKWNEEWDRGNAEGWANPPYNAWEDNEWNGKVQGGSGQNWHYKIVWVGNYTEDSSLIPAGGYGIWDQFAVIMDQGQDPTLGPGHVWFAHANPTGYGAYKQ